MFRYVKYRGVGVSCPLCLQQFSSWLAGKNNGTCPWCGSETRTRLLWLFLEKHSPILNEPQRILHFAPEECLRNRFQNLPHIEYTSADISAPGVDIHTDITNLIFDNDSFDMIICSHVLEHIPEDRVAMAELYRVLVPQGTVYIQVPYNSSRETDEDPTVTDPLERQKRFGQFDHVRVYGKDLKARLERVGFQVCEQRYTRTMDSSELLLYGLWDDVIFCCTKPEMLNDSKKG